MGATLGLVINVGQIAEGTTIKVWMVNAAGTAQQVYALDVHRLRPVRMPGESTASFAARIFDPLIRSLNDEP